MVILIAPITEDLAAFLQRIWQFIAKRSEEQLLDPELEGIPDDST